MSKKKFKQDEYPCADKQLEGCPDGKVMKCDICGWNDEVAQRRLKNAIWKSYKIGGREIKYIGGMKKDEESQ